MANFDPSRLDRIGTVGRRYVDEGRLPNAIVQIADRDGVVYSDAYGHADVESQKPVDMDTIFRIYSMTKPITSIVLMQLFEEGRFLLEDPVEKFLPDLANPQVMIGGSDQAPITRPAMRSITIRDLLTHASGLTYGFFRQTPLDARYRDQNLGDFVVADYSLAEAIRRLGAEPLLFDPGTSWNYSMSTDVCGAVIEAITGQTLAQALSERLLEPLEMFETGFSVPETAADRFTSLYVPNPSGDDSLVRIDDYTSSAYLQPPAFLSGGGGLVSTIGDYQKFCSMLLAEGVGNGNRIIGRRTLEYMTLNHLPGGKLLNELGQSVFAEVAMDGMGFGLGFSVVEDPAANGSLCSPGEFAWGGAASTAFWVDPVEGLTAIFMTQLLPSSKYPIRRELRSAVYQALG
jgi:CubicO group peptidase (beta-lactamase class C family)